VLIMNDKQKLIFYPFSLVLLVLFITAAGVLYQLKPLLHKQAVDKLELVLNGAISSIALMPSSMPVDNEQAYIENLISKVPADTNIRLSVFNAEGKLLADSHLSKDMVVKQTNDSKPLELTLSEVKGYAKVYRFSTFYSEQALYITYREVNFGYYVRGAMSVSDMSLMVSHVKKMLLLGALVLLILLAGVGVYLSNVLKQMSEKEKAEQDSKVEARTKEIHILQKMTTMLNAVQNFDEAGQVIFNAMIKITPKLSGKLYLLDDENKLNELISWGECFSSNLVALPHVQADNPELIKDVTETQHLVCIDLIGEQELFGAIHFLSCKSTMRDKQTRNLIMQLSEQISLGLSNLKIKIQLKHQAIRDPLTNLYNRRFMLEGFEQALNRAERHHYTLAVLMIDLDDFKSFNDNFGHKIGDLVLTEMAELLKSNIRMEDIACRFGGEEFCIICPDTGLTDGYALAEKLRHKVSMLKLREYENTVGQVTISTGVSIYPNNGVSVQQLLIAADEALYCAKREGRNTTVASKNYTKHQNFSS